jgi:gamma-glutamyltranspeptidase / glutathione hydrolase
MKMFDSRFQKLTLCVLLFGFTSCQSGPIKDASSAKGVNGQLAVQQSPKERMISEGFGKKWIVSTQGRAATQAVKEIFHAGGNLLDAAVAASFVISVERPQSTGLGGGGFLLYREAKTGRIYAIDFREKAPKAATEKMFLDAKGEVIPDKSLVGIYSAGVPGLVKGLSEVHQKFGKLPFDRLVKPAIRVAEEGFEVYPYLRTASLEEVGRLKKFPSSAAIFLKKGNIPYELGEKIVQKDLANTLREVGATHGKSFYSGRIAQRIVKESSKLGPWFTLQDFKNYSVRWMEPVHGKFKDYEVVSMPPPSSGGTHVIEILNILENQGLKDFSPLSAEAIHRKASAMQFSFIDRARYMGDPDFTKVPTAWLTSKGYAEILSQKIQPEKAMRLEEAESVVPVREEHLETTHFSIMDAEGNVVVSTQTINGWFGSGYVVPGTGILLNNEMDDFSAKPGASNLFGAVGSQANKVQPGKTPLSSMSPTIVLKDNEPVLAIGAPGGTRIITCVAQTILNYLEHGLSLYDSLALTRFHHQWKPDELVVENASMGEATLETLRNYGYTIKVGRVGCNVMGVSREGQVLHGVSDPRDFGQAYGE